ncbi:unnamed protein product, partial [Trichogramma brassicae]
MSEKTQQHHLVRRIQLKEDPYSKDEIMKLLRESEPNATLCCEFGAVGCHKPILAARSAHLMELLRRNPCAHPIFYVPGAKHDELQAVAHFMYHGEVDVELSKLRHFYKAVEPLQIHGLQWKNTKEKSEDKIRDLSVKSMMTKEKDNEIFQELNSENEHNDSRLNSFDQYHEKNPDVSSFCPNVAKAFDTPPIIIFDWGKLLQEKSEGNSRRSYSTAEKQSVVNAVNSGMSGAEASRKYDIPSSTVYSWIKKSESPDASRRTSISSSVDTSYSSASGRRSYTPSERQTVVNAIANGMSGAEAARTYGIPSSTVYSWKNSVPAAPTTNYSRQSNTSYGSSNISYGASNTSYGSSANQFSRADAEETACETTAGTCKQVAEASVNRCHRVFHQSSTKFIRSAAFTWHFVALPAAPRILRLGPSRLQHFDLVPMAVHEVQERKKKRALVHQAHAPVAASKTVCPKISDYCKIKSTQRGGFEEDLQLIRSKPLKFSINNWAHTHEPATARAALEQEDLCIIRYGKIFVQRPVSFKKKKKKKKSCPAYTATCLTNFETNETGAAAAQRVEDVNVNDDSSNPSSPSPSLSSASSTSSEDKMEIAHAPSSPLAMNNEQQPQLSAQPQAAPPQQQQHQQVAPQSPQPQVQHHQQQQQLHHQQQQQHQSAPANTSSTGMQQYCVSWNSYASHLQGAFPKLLSSEQFVDVSLACDGGSFKCHKVVLSACSEYMERILLDLPCQHPVIFMTNMEFWELQALIQFMYHGEVYVEEAKLRQLLKAADALQIRGLSNKNTDLNGARDDQNTHNNIHQQNAHHSTPKVGTSNAASTPSASNASSTAGDFPQADDNGDNSADGSDCDLQNIIPTLPSGTTAVPTSENLSYDTEPIQEDMHHSYDMSLAGGSCETSVVEGPGTVKLEPDDHHHNMMAYNDKNNYSINMVPMNASCQPSSPFPAIEGNDFVGAKHKNIQNGQNGHNLSYQKRQRRSEAELKLAADLVSRGMTFQVASEQYSIPISTIRFYMARKVYQLVLLDSAHRHCYLIKKRFAFNRSHVRYDEKMRKMKNCIRVQSMMIIYDDGMYIASMITRRNILTGAELAETLFHLVIIVGSFFVSSFLMFHENKIMTIFINFFDEYNRLKDANQKIITIETMQKGYQIGTVLGSLRGISSHLWHAFRWHKSHILAPRRSHHTRVRSCANLTLRYQKMVILLKKNTSLQALKMFLTFLLCKLILMIICYPSQQMKEASENIHIACYSTGWYEFKSKIRYLLLLMMVRASRPCCFMACSGFPVNFSTVTFNKKKSRYNSQPIHKCVTVHPRSTLSNFCIEREYKDVRFLIKRRKILDLEDFTDSLFQLIVLSGTISAYLIFILQEKKVQMMFDQFFAKLLMFSDGNEKIFILKTMQKGYRSGMVLAAYQLDCRTWYYHEFSNCSYCKFEDVNSFELKTIDTYFIEVILLTNRHRVRATRWSSSDSRDKRANRPPRCSSKQSRTNQSGPYSNYDETILDIDVPKLENVRVCAKRLSSEKRSWSVSVYKENYCSEWYQLKPKNRLIFLMIMMRTLKPCGWVAGP